MIQRQCLNQKCRGYFLVKTPYSNKKFCGDGCRWVFWKDSHEDTNPTTTTDIRRVLLDYNECSGCNILYDPKEHALGCPLCSMLESLRGQK